MWGDNSAGIAPSSNDDRRSLGLMSGAGLEAEMRVLLLSAVFGVAVVSPSLALDVTATTSCREFVNVADQEDKDAIGDVMKFLARSWRDLDNRYVADGGASVTRQLSYDGFQSFIIMTLEDCRQHSEITIQHAADFIYQENRNAQEEAGIIFRMPHKIPDSDF